MARAKECQRGLHFDVLLVQGPSDGWSNRSEVKTKGTESRMEGSAASNWACLRHHFDPFQKPSSSMWKVQKLALGSLQWCFKSKAWQWFLRELLARGLWKTWRGRTLHCKKSFGRTQKTCHQQHPTATRRCHWRLPFARNSCYSRSLKGPGLDFSRPDFGNRWNKVSWDVLNWLAWASHSP